MTCRIAKSWQVESGIKWANRLTECKWPFICLFVSFLRVLFLAFSHLSFSHGQFQGFISKILCSSFCSILTVLWLVVKSVLASDSAPVTCEWRRQWSHYGEKRENPQSLETQSTPQKYQFCWHELQWYNLINVNRFPLWREIGPKKCACPNLLPTATHSLSQTFHSSNTRVAVKATVNSPSNYVLVVYEYCLLQGKFLSIMYW